MKRPTFCGMKKFVLKGMQNAQRNRCHLADNGERKVLQSLIFIVFDLSRESTCWGESKNAFVNERPRLQIKRPRSIEQRVSCEFCNLTFLKWNQNENEEETIRKMALSRMIAYSERITPLHRSMHCNPIFSIFRLPCYNVMNANI